ncbi:RagB/SusD family nutrient uptake outer membrane protein, partial [Klebsiella oxytoca]
VKDTDKTIEKVRGRMGAIVETPSIYPDMTAEEKLRLKAEAKITIAVQYSEMLRHYGALPIVDHAIMPEEMGLPERATLQQTVDFITRLLDEAIACKELPWALPEDDLSNESGRMT